MTTLYPPHWQSYLDILLVFLRLSGFFVFIPGFSHRAIPNIVRVLFALAFSLAINPIVQGSVISVSDSLSSLILASIREVSVGLLMGFAAYVTFEAINLGAQFVGYQMGLGTAGLIDPQHQSNESIMVPFHSWIVLMIFFLGDFHHEMLRLFVSSFVLTRKLLDPVVITQSGYTVLVGLTARLFILAVQMAAPFTFLILVCNAAMGILARMIPQMNLLLFSFPITITLSLCAFYLIAPEMMDYFQLRLSEVAVDVIEVLKTV